MNKTKVLHYMYSKMGDSSYKVAIITDIGIFKIYNIPRQELDEIINTIKFVIGKKVDSNKLLFGHSQEVDAEFEEIKEYNEYDFGSLIRLNQISKREFAILGSNGVLVVKEALDDIKDFKKPVNGRVIISIARYYTLKIIKVGIGNSFIIIKLTPDSDILLRRPEMV